MKIRKKVHGTSAGKFTYENGLKLNMVLVHQTEQHATRKMIFYKTKCITSLGIMKNLLMDGAFQSVK